MCFYVLSLEFDLCLYKILFWGDVLFCFVMIIDWVRVGCFFICVIKVMIDINGKSNNVYLRRFDFRKVLICR